MKKFMQKTWRICTSETAGALLFGLAVGGMLAAGYMNDKHLARLDERDKQIGRLATENAWLNEKIVNVERNAEAMEAEARGFIDGQKHPRTD